MRVAKSLTTLIAILLAGAVGAGPATEPAAPALQLPPSADRTTLYLAAPPIDPAAEPVRTLTAEVYRQALLIAARDDLGLYTRDGLLREYDSAPPDAPAGLRQYVRRGERGKLRIHVGLTDPSQPAEAMTEVGRPRSMGILDVVPAVAVSAEVYERQLPAFLKQIGFKSDVEPKPDQDVGPLADGVNDLLYGTTLFAPLAAVQRTHAQIRSDGASPDRLAALVRGYANLSRLSRPLWSSDEKVFAARSLVYAQRLVVRWPTRADSLWARAYAEAVVGLHGAALKDVAAAKRIAPAGAAVPPWAAMIEPLCKYDLSALTDAIANAKGPRAPLAALMAFTSADQCGSSALVLQMGEATLHFNPACWAILDTMIEHAGVGPGARLTEAQPMIMAATLPDEVAKLTATDDAVQKAVAQLSAEIANARARRGGVAATTVADVGRALVASGDVRVEPSLVLAGRLAQEVNFLQAERRANFVTTDYGWNGVDTVQSLQPLIDGHPYKEFVDAFSLPRSQRAGALTNLEVAHCSEQMHDLWATVLKDQPVPGHITGSAIWARSHATYDGTIYDTAPRLAPFNAKAVIDEGMQYLDVLRSISPSCPAVQAFRFRDHWDDKGVQKDLDGWADKYSQQPGTLAVLAIRFKSAGRTDDARQALEQYVKVAGDYWAGAELADLYLAAGDEAKWLATLEDAIKRPDYGLNHAQAQVKIAKHFMAKGDFQRALPYADAAEQTQAEWAMICDADCHRGLGDTATADRIVAAAKAHYGH